MAWLKPASASLEKEASVLLQLSMVAELVFQHGGWCI